MKTLILGITGVYLVVMAVMDHRTGKIPWAPGVVCIVSVLIAQILDGRGGLLLLGGFLPGIFLYFVRKITRGQIGGGDVLVYFAVGAALGAARTFCLLLASLLLASAAALFLIVVRHAGRKDTLPFVPFTAAAYGLVVCL